MPKIKSYTGPVALDENLMPRYWRNDDVAQNHYLVSHLSKRYPLMKDLAPKILCKPGKVTLIPHRYYTIHTRDGTPAKGSWFVGDAIEDAALKSLSRGDAQGHEN